MPGVTHLGPLGFSLTRCQFISANSIHAIANRISRESNFTIHGQKSVERDLVKHGEASELTLARSYAGAFHTMVINHESKALVNELG